VHDSEEEAEFHRKEMEDVNIPSLLPVYMPLKKLNVKLVREPEEGKFWGRLPQSKWKTGI